MGPTAVEILAKSNPLNKERKTKKEGERWRQTERTAREMIIGVKKLQSHLPYCRRLPTKREFTQ